MALSTKLVLLLVGLWALATQAFLSTAPAQAAVSQTSKSNNPITFL